MTYRLNERRHFSSKPMTTEEAFVKVLQMHGIKDAFGIIGSAMMPISDLFPAAGIKFWDCAHEYNAGMMADGYSRVTGELSMMIAQNGPGITNFVTPVKTAYWNHTPLLLVTPQAANKTIGQGGFQEVEQMAMFKDCVCYQEEVRDPTRIAEVLNRVIEKAVRGSAPAQINIPRDLWTKVVEINLPVGVELERMSPRIAWRAICRAMPKDAIISTDIGNNCAIGNAYPSFESGRKYLSPVLYGPCGYGFPSILGAKIGNPDVPVVGFAGDGAFGISMNELTACGRNDWKPVTMVVFRNYQWGAEKRNTTLWYADNFVGTELNRGVEYAEIAKACGLKGIKVDTVSSLEDALKTAIEGQMQRNETTLIEVLLNQELGEPFRRDAMTAPNRVAGVSGEDMRSS